MKKILTLIMLLIIAVPKCFAYPVGNPFPPFQIAGNLYYVGADDLASYLIVTPKGNILINSSMEESVPMIKASVEKLGFKWSDTKILLISHAHYDHDGGSALIKQETKAQYMVMAQDVSSVETGGKTDFQYGNDESTYYTPTKVDKVLHDGDKVELGGTVLTAHLTPGHTPGNTTWSMQANDHGKKYDVVILGSLTINPGYELVNNKTYPNIAKDYEKAFRVLKSLPCDIFLGAHAGYFNMEKKYKLISKTSKNPFVDPLGYKKYVEEKEKEFDRALISGH